MPYTNLETYCFTSNDFNDVKPDFAPSTSTYAGNPIFANRYTTLHLGGFQFGYVKFRITFTGPLTYLAVAFSHPDGQPVSVSNNGGALFQVSSQSTGIVQCVVYDYGVNNANEFQVIVNAQFNNPTDLLKVELAPAIIGSQINQLPTCINVEYECGLPLYSAETGLHTYSPYDAQYDIARLRTILYSQTPVASWARDTRVFSSPYFQNPSLPYYYGIGDNVYKVGNEYDRAYGTKTRFRVHKKWFGKPKVYKETIGPQWFGPYDPTTQPYSPSCVVPKMSRVGLINEVLLNRDLIQPKQYRYYMGYDARNQQKSNDSVFTYWSWSNRVNYPILGSTHALGKIGQGALSGMDSIPGYPNGLLYNSNMLGIYGAAAGMAVAYVVGAAIVAAGTVTATITGVGAGCLAPILVSSVAFPPILIVLIVVLFLWLIWQFFGPKTKYYDEDCVNFLHQFTNTPYISGNTNTQLFRDINLTRINDGYHSDGIYFYYQVGSAVRTKNQVFTNEFVNDNPVTFNWNSSILPDVPRLVTEWTKLLVLPYTSGKPLPFCNGTIYYNTRLTATVNPPGKCCRLELCNPITVTIDANSTWSCISQADANVKAQALLDAAIISAQGNYIPTPLLTDEQTGFLNSSFTHELKIETNPTNVTVEFDGRVSMTASIGTRLYYDQCGCTPVLDGYYAISGTTSYRTFYHTTNGIVDSIYTMQNSNSTTTTTGQPIITTNLDYSSNWYLTDSTQSTVEYYANYLTIPNINRDFDPNLLYNNYTVNYPTPPGNPYTYKLKKGFIKTPTSRNNFQLYTNFNTTLYGEATSAWYKPLIEWLDESSFYYQPGGRTSYINIYEQCDYLYGTTSNRSIYVTCTDINGFASGADANLRISIQLYNTNGTLINTSPFVLNLNQGQSSQVFNLNNIVPLGTNLGSIVIVSITGGLSTYLAGDTQTCTSKICNQVWMTHNLTTKKYLNGNVIPQVTDPTQWSNLTTGAWCYYNNDPSTEATYGILYNYYAISDVRGIAPTGWRIPTSSDWSTLSACLGGDSIAGGKLKETGTSHWLAPNTSATNLFDFTALPSGYRNGGNGAFYEINQSTSWWVADGSVNNTALVRVVSYNSATFPQGLTTKDTGFSIRCIKI